MEIEPFGKINTNKLDDYYDAEILVNHKAVELDLNFESETIDESILNVVSRFIANIQTNALQSFDAILDDYDSSEESEAQLYLQHHLEEFPEEDILEVFSTADITKELYFEKLELSRVGFYLEEHESFIVFDIQLPKRFTDYLIAVTFNSKGKLESISMES